MHDSETPAKNKQVITACAFIHKDFEGVRKVFLPKRAETKKFLPGVFELPGGHIDFGEDILEGLKREIFEEFDMKISVGDVFYVFTYRNELKGSHSIEVVYFATFTSPISKISLNPEDHSESGWFSEDEMDSKVANKNRRSDDSEIKAMLKGFSLLRGDRLFYG